MLTMNYSITLPADYDMTIVRERVARLGPTMDTYEHLAFKAFLMTEAGKDGNTENRYAPFYLWHSEQGIHTFLSGEGFRGLTHSFGWVPVRTGIVHHYQEGNLNCRPTYATYEQVSIAPHTDISTLWHAEEQLQAALLLSPHAYLTLVSFDPTSWTLVRFTLWDRVPEEEQVRSSVQCLTLLHLAAPRLVAKDL